MLRLVHLPADRDRSLLSLIGGRTVLLIAGCLVLPIITRLGQLVHRTRRRQRRNRHPVMGMRASSNPRALGVGRTARGEPSIGVLLIGSGRLSTTNQINERSEMNT